MLVDWMTARILTEHLDPEIWRALLDSQDRLMRFSNGTGEVKWETSAWDSVRSDSHQIAFKVGGNEFWLQGSPARVCGTGDAVFGEGPASALDLVGCLTRMIRFVSSQIGVVLPVHPALWLVSRIDITSNLLLSSLADVRIALRELRECEGGRYRVSQQAGDTVYWSHTSKLKSGKAYAKGPHIQYQTGRPGYTGREYTSEEKAVADRLLRLELSLKREFFFRLKPKSWYSLTADDLRKEWNDYFLRMVGDSEMKTETDVKKKIDEAAEIMLIHFNRSRKRPIVSSKGIANSAYCLYLTIQNEGWQKAREVYSKSAWYRGLQVLREAGFGDADIAAGKVVSFRRKIIEFQQVESWYELKRAA